MDLPIKERRKLLIKNVNVIPNRVEISELTITKKGQLDEDGQDPLKVLMAKVSLIRKCKQII